MSTEITLPQATVGIVTALPKEHAAVCAVFQTKVRAAGVSGTVYDLCTVPCVGGQIIVAITQFLGMGNNSTMKALIQTGSSLSACGHAQAGGRVSVPLKSDFLSIFKGFAFPV